MEVLNKKIIPLLLTLAVFIISSCDSYYQKQIGESYFIRYIDLKRTMDISFGDKTSSEGIIDPTVFEVYWNDKYILAKTHPDLDKRNLTKYYIIEKVIFGKNKASDYIIGPIDKIEFDTKINRLKLNINNMEHILYDDLK